MTQTDIVRTYDVEISRDMLRRLIRHIHENSFKKTILINDVEDFFDCRVLCDPQANYVLRFKSGPDAIRFALEFA